MTVTDPIHQAVLQVPATAWTPAIEIVGEIRDSAWGADLASDVRKGWPARMRLIVRKERSRRPGDQHRLPRPSVVHRHPPSIAGAINRLHILPNLG